MDVNMIREMANFQGIPYCDEKMTFFYDETGNCGKFSLNEEGVNDPTALNNDFMAIISFLYNYLFNLLIIHKIIF